MAPDSVSSDVQYNNAYYMYNPHEQNAFAILFPTLSYRDLTLKR